MKYSEVPNLKFGGVPGLDYTTYLVINRLCALAVVIASGWYAHKVFKLSKVPYSVLWMIYNFVVCGVLTTGYLSGDVSSYNFLTLTFLHIYTEFLLAVRTLEGKPEFQDWWGAVGSAFIFTSFFFAMCLWQPMNFLAFGSLVSLPVDLLTIPAAWTVMQRATSRTVWWFGLVWALHAPIAYGIMGSLVWGMNAKDNYAGATILPIMIGIFFQIVFLVPALGKLDSTVIGDAKKEDEGAVELGLIAPKEDKPCKKAPGMMWGLRVVGTILIFFIGPTTLLPFALGYNRLEQVMFNACDSYIIGEVQTMKNIGPNFLIPGFKCNIDFDN